MTSRCTTPSPDHWLISRRWLHVQLPEAAATLEGPAAAALGLPALLMRVQLALASGDHGAALELLAGLPDEATRHQPAVIATIASLQVPLSWTFWVGIWCSGLAVWCSALALSNWPLYAAQLLDEVVHCCSSDRLPQLWSSGMLQHPAAILHAIRTCCFGSQLWQPDVAC